MDTKRLEQAALQYAEKGHTDKAIQIYKRLLREHKEQTHYCVKIAETYARRGATAEAVRWFEVAGKRYADAGHAAKAAAIAKIVAKLDPSRTAVERRLTQLYAKRTEAEAVPEEPAVLELPPIEIAPTTVGAKAEAVNLATEDEPVILLEEVSEEVEAIVIEEEANPELIAELEGEIVEVSPESPDIHSVIAKLPRVPIFSDLTPTELPRFLQSVDVKVFGPGETVVAQGDSGDAFYVITGGEATVAHSDREGSQTKLATLPEGAFFGEFAYLSGAPRTASVVAKTRLEVLEIGRTALDALLKEFPRIEQVLRKFFRDRALHTLVHVSPLFKTLASAEQRALVAKCTLVEAKPGDVVIREDSAGEALYVILYGGVVVSKKNEWGGIDDYAELSVGDFFGEMALLSGGKTSATVTAKYQTALLRLGRSEFVQMIQEIPTLRPILETYAEERRRYNERFLDYLITLGEQGIV